MLAQEAQPVDFIEVVGLGAMVAVALLVDAKGGLCPVAGCGQIAGSLTTLELPARELV